MIRINLLPHRAEKRRARQVQGFLLSNECRLPASQITGCIGIGDSWSTGGPDDNDPDWRGVEVIIESLVNGSAREQAGR